MANISNSIDKINNINRISSGESFLNKVHPLAKLVVTFIFVTTCISFDANNISGLMLMWCYIIIIFFLGDLSIVKALYHVRLALPVIVLIGIANPFLDTTPVISISGMTITSGIISFITLLIKGVLTLLATYAFAASTPLDEFCQILRKLHFPSVLVTSISLTCRYLLLLVEEAGEMWQAYSLRAPSHRGVHIKSWGSFAGSLLLRSINRAENLYESMCLRGFDGDFLILDEKKFSVKDFIFVILWLVVFIAIRLSLYNFVRYYM